MLVVSRVIKGNGVDTFVKHQSIWKQDIELVSGRNEINIVGLIEPHERTGDWLAKVVRWSFRATQHHSVADCSVFILCQTVPSVVGRVLFGGVLAFHITLVNRANSFTS